MVSVILCMKLLVAKLGKCDVSLGLQKLHFNSCAINKFFINILCLNIFIEVFIGMVKVQSAFKIIKTDEGIRPASPANVT